MNTIYFTEKIRRKQLIISERMVFHINNILENSMFFYCIHVFKNFRNLFIYKQPVQNRIFEVGFIRNFQILDIVSKPYKFWP